MTYSKKFFSATEKFSSFEDEIVAAPYIRKAFDYNGKKAELQICGLGFYELFINGEKITKSRLAPYISNPNDTLYYDIYDVTSFLKEEKNVVGILLGNGFLNSFAWYIWDNHKAEYVSAPKFALAFYIDGKLSFEADESFKCHPSPILFDEYHMGEHYDARCEIENWCQPDFNDEEWNNVIPARTPKGEARISIAPPVKVIREITPIGITESEHGYIYDFGENTSGVCRLNIVGERGQKVTLTHAELVTDGKIDIRSAAFNKFDNKEFLHKDIYILSGKNQEIYEPYFTYHGFQYVYVEGITKEQATKSLLTMLVTHSELQEKGNFACSNDILNKLQENTRRSVLSNMVHIPTDCPHREKNGWTGDMTLSAEQISLNFEIKAMMEEWLFNVRKAQDSKGRIPGVVPTAGFGYDDYNGPAWDGVIAELPYTLYRYSGDIGVLQDNADAIDKYLTYMQTRKNGSGLFAYGLGDWSPPGRDSDQYTTPLEITDSLYCLSICERAEEIYTLLNDARAEKARTYKEEIKSAFRAKYVKDGKMSVTTQSALSMAIYYGAVEEEKAQVFAQLLDAIHKNDDHFDVGVLGARVLFRVLAEMGHIDLALKLILQPTFPSYAPYVYNGATTLMEDIQPLIGNSLVAETGLIHSLNHHFWGDISALFISYIVGIKVNPDGKDYDKIVISPNFASELEYAQAYYIHEKGKIFVRWERNGDKIVLTVEYPQEVAVIYNISQKENVELIERNYVCNADLEEKTKLGQRVEKL